MGPARSLDKAWHQAIRKEGQHALPKSKEKRSKLAIEIGEDGFYLLEQAWQANALVSLLDCQALKALQLIWIQQSYRDEDKTEWRTNKNKGQPPANRMISSPDDFDIHYCVKRTTEWTGYKVPTTETCEEDQLRLITQVAPTSSTVHAVKMTTRIQNELSEQDLQPKLHMVDEGFMEIDLLLESKKRNIDLFGPVPSSKSWQDRTEGALDHS